jgi:uroporphyrinogen-III synthase
VTTAAALHGRRVVVTRSSAQAGSLAGLLEAAGAVPVVVPLVEQVPEPQGAAALAALHPDDFDWLVVTSPNGAQAYLTAHAVAPAAVAAVGATTAAALADGGVTATLVPTQQSAAGLLTEFPSGPGTVLLVQAVDAEPAMADGLRAAGWQVTVVTPYRTVPSRPGAGLQLAALSADAVLFASGSAATAWVQVFGTSTPPVVVAIGPQTAAAATAAGLKVSLVATDHSLRGLVDALASVLASTA